MSISVSKLYIQKMIALYYELTGEVKTIQEKNYNNLGKAPMVHKNNSHAKKQGHMEVFNILLY